MTRLFVALLAGDLLFSPFTFGAPPVIPAAVKLRVRQKVDNGYTPGIVVSMVNADGRTHYAYGNLSHMPGSPAPDETTLYELASVTKTFTTVLLAQMVESGDVRLSDRVGSFLPPGVSMPARGGDSITLEQLANHTSGIPSTPPNLPATITRLDNQFENYTEPDFYSFLNTYTLTRAPGSGYEYSNAGIGLLGHVLALSQDSDYETLLRERVLKPMGILDTAIELSASQKDRYATGHHGVVGRPPFVMNILAPAGALKSCTSDLCTYLEYQLGTNTAPISPALALSHQLSYDLPNVYGYDQALGWWLFDGGDTVQHGGDSFGSTAFVGFRKTTGTGVAILSNNRSHFPAGISDLGFYCLDPSRQLGAVPTTKPLDDEFLRARVGDYGFFRIERRLGRPVLVIPSQIDYTLYSDNSDGLSSADIGLQIRIAFDTDPSTGLVDTMNYSQNGALPTPFPRIRHPGRLGIHLAGGNVTLEAQGEADQDYPLETSTDLKNWLPFGTIDTWTQRSETLEAGSDYFRLLEP